MLSAKSVFRRVPGASLLLLLAWGVVGCGSGSSASKDATNAGDSDCVQRLDGTVLDVRGDWASMEVADQSQRDGKMPPVGGDDVPHVDSADPSDGADGADQMDGSDGGMGPVLDPGCVEIHGVGWAFNPAATSGDYCKNCNDKIDCPSWGTYGIADRTTVWGNCVCETMPNFFFSTETMSIHDCDVDNDGWVTIAAKPYIKSNDPAIQKNAKCRVMRPGEIVFHPDEASGVEYKKDIAYLAFYEPDNRDDYAALEADSGLPAYGGRKLLAMELNALTKACVTRDADYNGNGVPDVSETADSEDILPGFKAYAPYVYFMETHYSWYDWHTNILHIAERLRLPLFEPPGLLSKLAVSIGFGTLPGGWWSSCDRGRDSAYDPAAARTGFDLAGFDGMHHHSQFKCLDVVNEEELQPNQPHKMTADALMEQYQPNSCEADYGYVYWDPPSRHPLDVDFICKDKPQVAAGDVVWGITRHTHYTTQGGYVRGCLNPCVEGWAGLSACPGWADGLATCGSDALDFDRPFCQ